MESLHNRTVVVACGVGRDSTGMLVGLHERGIRPAAILFADVGSEKQGTYNFIPHLQAWLARVAFPPLTIVRYQPVRAPYTTLEGNMLANATLPGATFNRGSCTMKFKVVPQDKFCRSFEPCLKAWECGDKVLKLIEFESTEGYRQQRAADRAHGGSGTADANRYEYQYPLMEWGWNLERCKQAIDDAGMPIPPKSACFFCPNQRPHEVAELSDDERARIIRMELRAEPYNRKVHGLWRKPRTTLGLPGSITEFILQENLPFTPLAELPQVPLHPNCQMAERQCTFRPPHSLPLLKQQLEDAGHAVPDCETDGHLALVESLQGMLF
jgi:hypothetical protein